ncbi:MAG: hypothetical protein AB1813_19190 [Verrucomicrobiota bacterium]|jgi:hypothetical protein
MKRTQREIELEIQFEQTRKKLQEIQERLRKARESRSTSMQVRAMGKKKT